MQLLVSVVLLLISLAVAQSPPTSPCRISNPATGLFIDLQDPNAEFADTVVGNDATGLPSQVWRLSAPGAGNLICTKPSLTPLGIYAAGAEGEALSVFFKAWTTVTATAVGAADEDSFTLAIGSLLVTAGVPGGPLTLESPEADKELQKWIFTPVPTQSQ